METRLRMIIPYMNKWPQVKIVIFILDFNHVSRYLKKDDTFLSNFINILQARFTFMTAHFSGLVHTVTSIKSGGVKLVYGLRALCVGAVIVVIVW